MGGGGTDVGRSNTKNIFQPIPDNTSYKRMDLLGAAVPENERRSDADVGAAVLEIPEDSVCRRVRRLGRQQGIVGDDVGQERSRNNPSAPDQLDMDMKKGYPNATTVGPGSVE
jgi:hypothetical protein